MSETYEYPEPPIESKHRPNEELALLVQAGDHAAHEQLWRQNARLLYRILRRYFDVARKYSMDKEDILQQSYFIIKAAALAYDSAKPYSFTTYLGKQAQRQIRSLFKSWRKNEGNTLSLNTPAGDEGQEHQDILIDPDGERFVDELSETDLQRAIRVEVSLLPDRQQQAIRLHYLEGLPREEIAARMGGVSRQTVSNTVEKGLSLLRQSNALRGLYHEHKQHYQTLPMWRFLWQPEYFEAAARLERMQSQHEYISYGRQQMVVAYATARLISALGLGDSARLETTWPAFPMDKPTARRVFCEALGLTA